MDTHSVKVREAYTRIKFALLRHGVPAGTFLNITSVAEKMRISQTPVREALIWLLNEELIDFIPNRGYYAKYLSFGDLKAEYEMAYMIAKYSIEKGEVSFEETGEDDQCGQPGLSIIADDTGADCVAGYLERLYKRVAMTSGNSKLIRATRLFNERTGYVRRFGLKIDPEFIGFLSGMEHLEICLLNGDRSEALSILDRQHAAKVAMMQRVLHKLRREIDNAGGNFEDLLGKLET
jgi:hypothetical protein